MRLGVWDVWRARGFRAETSATIRFLATQIKRQARP